MGIGASIDAALAPGVRRRELWAWAMYDFANSGYTTVIITAVFNAYFVSTIAAGADWATFAWTASLALSYALIVLTAPIVGALADLRAIKKRLLLLTTLGCVAATAALALTGPGTLVLHSCRNWRSRRRWVGCRAGAGRWAIWVGCWHWACAWAGSVSRRRAGRPPHSSCRSRC
jgi:MFS family permease